MTQTERRKYLISALLNEKPQYREIEIPAGEREQKILLRSLFNVRMPMHVIDDFYLCRIPTYKKKYGKRNYKYRKFETDSVGNISVKGDITTRNAMVL